MNSLCDSYLTDDSLQELSEISDFFLTSTVDHIKTEPADVIQQVGHVTVTSRALAVRDVKNLFCAVFFVVLKRVFVFFWWPLLISVDIMISI